MLECLEADRPGRWEAGLLGVWESVRLAPKAKGTGRMTRDGEAGMVECLEADRLGMWEAGCRNSKFK